MGNNSLDFLFGNQPQSPTGVGSLMPGNAAPQAPQPGVGQLTEMANESALLPGPPKDQVEYASRARGWSALADKFKNDPVYQLALLKFGTEMVQPVAPGQTPLGHAGRAIQSGADFVLQQQQADAKNQMADRQIKVLERGQDEKEKTGALNRQELQQKIEQNTRAYPQLIKKLDAEIDRLRSQGKVDDAQAEYYRERARLYPQEVNADLARAKAAEKAAGKPSAGETTGRIFDSTVKAMVKSEGITEDEARTRLGTSFLGKSEGKAAGVQNAEQFKRDWKIANPQKEGEDGKAYEARAAQATLDYQTQRKQEDYFSQKLEFINKNGVFFKDTDEAGAKFDEYWKRHFGGLPGAGGKNDEAAGIKAAVEKAGGKYEPDKYDYRVVNGQVQRKLKSAK